jgi:hypothetical protein
MKRFLECLWETITFILVTILLALAMLNEAAPRRGTVVSAARSIKTASAEG